MEHLSVYKIFRGACAPLRNWGLGTRLSGSIAVKAKEEPTQAISDSPASVKLSVKKWNQNILVKPSRSLNNVEKSVLPIYVLEFYLEDAILKRLSENNVSTESETSGTGLRLEFTSETTAVEYNRLLRSVLKIDKSTTPVIVSQTASDDGNQVRKGGLLPFVTKLPTFRQRGVPQAGFASIAEKISDRFLNQDKPIQVTKDSTTKVLKGSKTKTSPLEGSAFDGSFTKVTRMDLLGNEHRNVNVSPYAVGLAATVKGAGIASKKVGLYTLRKPEYIGKPFADSVTEAYSMRKPENVGEVFSMPKPECDENQLAEAPREGARPKPKHELKRLAKTFVVDSSTSKPDQERDTVMQEASIEPKSSQEFLKYQTAVPEHAKPPRPEMRPRAEMKECSVVSQNGSLRDAQSLIACNKSQHAPRSLMSVEYQYDSDHKTLELMQKYKVLKMREVDYHLAQIKKHRKVLLELMYKTPFQKPLDQSKYPYN